MDIDDENISLKHKEYKRIMKHKNKKIIKNVYFSFKYILIFYIEKQYIIIKTKFIPRQ